MTQDRFEKIGTPQDSTADDLTATPIGDKGATSSAPYPAGGNGEVQPLEAARLTNPPTPPIGGGTPAPTP